MKKAIIITISIIILLLIYVFFLKSTLIITPKPSPANITIDKKLFENSDKASIKLGSGKHKLKIEKEGYENYESTIKLGFLENKNINIDLKPTNETQDKQDIERISKQFTEVWFTYKSQTDKDYLEKIKPFMTKNFYEGTYYVNTKRPQDFKGQVPLNSLASTAEIIDYSGNKSLVNITVESNEPTTSKSYSQKAIITLIKENNNWLVDYLKPVL